MIHVAQHVNIFGLHMISASEWLGFGIKKKIVEFSDNDDCGMSFKVSKTDHDDVNLYDEKYLSINNIGSWITYGVDNGFIDERGCAQHQIKGANLKLTANNVVWLYPEKILSLMENYNFAVNSTSMINRKYNGHQSTDKNIVLDIIKNAKQIRNSNAFIDIGSGSGSALEVAKDFYDYLTGVEVELFWIEEARKRVDATFINIPAENYFIENKNMHIFLSNPFDNSILKKFLLNNIDSILDNKSLILYYYPIEADHLFEFYGLKTLFKCEDYSIYGS